MHGARRSPKSLNAKSDVRDACGGGTRRPSARRIRRRRDRASPKNSRHPQRQTRYGPRRPGRGVAVGATVAAARGLLRRRSERPAAEGASEDAAAPAGLRSEGRSAEERVGVARGEPPRAPAAPEEDLGPRARRGRVRRARHVARGVERGRRRRLGRHGRGVSAPPARGDAALLPVRTQESRNLAALEAADSYERSPSRVPTPGNRRNLSALETVRADF